MTEKLTNRRISRKIQPIPVIVSNNLPVKKRGRPKGAKNKPKTPPALVQLTQSVVKQARRGRPKGSKNKPKSSPQPEKKETAPKKRGRPFKSPQTAAPPVEVQKSVQSVQLEEHPLLKAVKWLEKYMHPAEMLYYRNRANKMGVSLPVAMASDILGLFNVQNPEICKQIKKNNFIATNTTYVVHQ